MYTVLYTKLYFNIAPVGETVDFPTCLIVETYLVDIGADITQESLIRIFKPN